MLPEKMLHCFGMRTPFLKPSFSGHAANRGRSGFRVLVMASHLFTEKKKGRIGNARKRPTGSALDNQTPAPLWRDRSASLRGRVSHRRGHSSRLQRMADHDQHAEL